MPCNRPGSHQAWKQRHTGWKPGSLCCFVLKVPFTAPCTSVKWVNLTRDFPSGNIWLAQAVPPEQAGSDTPVRDSSFSITVADTGELPCLLCWFSDSSIRNHPQPSATCTPTHTYTSNLLFFSRFCQFTRSARPPYTLCLGAHEQTDLMEKIKFKWLANRILQRIRHTLACRRGAVKAIQVAAFNRTDVPSRSN